MKPAALVLALSLAVVGLAFPPTEAANCIVGNSRDCVVSVIWVVCVTEPCDGLVVCAAHGKVCTDRLLP